MKDKLTLRMKYVEAMHHLVYLPNARRPSPTAHCDEREERETYLDDVCLMDVVRDGSGCPLLSKLAWEELLVWCEVMGDGKVGGGNRGSFK